MQRGPDTQALHQADARTGPEVLRQAAVEGYSTAFWWAAGIFALGALVCGSLPTAGNVRPGAVPRPTPDSGAHAAG